MRSSGQRPSRQRSEPIAAQTRWRTLLAVPLAVAHRPRRPLVRGEERAAGRNALIHLFLSGLLVAAVLAAGRATALVRTARWMRHGCPLIAAAVLFLTGWELITAGFRLLPMPYFPSPAGVLQSLINDRAMIFDSTWHSLLLLLSGYALGVAVGLITGVCIGWFDHARYWGMPVLKVVGPIPATAWIPLAMVVSPSAMFSAVGLIALAVWFPVTMLTASGISNTRASYLDVARTLGAGRAYLIFRVAIPPRCRTSSSACSWVLARRFSHSSSPRQSA